MEATTCPECGLHVAPSDPSAGGRPKLFCSPAHKKAFYAKMTARGQQLTALMQTWRIESRRKGGDRQLAAYARRESCRLLDGYAREDAAAGRDPRKTVSRKQAAAWRAGDKLA